MELNALERIVLSLLLAGDDPILAILRAQLEAATITSRKMTGVGFFTNFAVPESMERTTLRDFTVDDVFGNFSEATEAGFLLFVRNGTLIMLEGFTYGSDAWPLEPRLTDAYYMHHEPADSPMLRRCAVRDLEQLRASWSNTPH